MENNEKLKKNIEPVRCEIIKKFLRISYIKKLKKLLQINIIFKKIPHTRCTLF